MTATYYATVTNHRTGESFDVTRGELDPNLDVQLIDPLIVTHGHDPVSDFPGPLYPPTAQINLWCRSTADIPAWRTGDPITVRMHTGIWISPPGQWVDWVNLDFALSEQSITPGPDGAQLLNVIAVDYLATLTGQTMTMTRNQELAGFRVGAIIDRLEGFISKPMLAGSSSTVAAITYTDAPIVDALMQVLLSNVDGGLQLPVARWDTALGGWRLEFGFFASGPTYGDMPFHLTLTGDLLTRTDSDPSDVWASSGARIGIVDACAAPVPGASWAYLKPVNTLWLTTLNPDGTRARSTRRHAAVAQVYGDRVRQVDTVLATSATSDIADALTYYMPAEEDSAPGWLPARVTIDTGRISEWLERSQLAQSTNPILLSTDTVRGPVVLVVTDVDPALSPNARDHIAAAITQTTWTIAAGRLEMTCDLSPSLPTAANDSSTATGIATWQTLRNVWPAVQYHGPGNHIDPALTYADMRLIGAS